MTIKKLILSPHPACINKLAGYATNKIEEQGKRKTEKERDTERETDRQRQRRGRGE